MTTRLRCAGRGCEHAASAHDENGVCGWCLDTGRCRGWALRRAHRWRENAWETWHSAWHTWWLAGEAVGAQDDVVPQPTFKATLIGLTGVRP